MRTRYLLVAYIFLQVYFIPVQSVTEAEAGLANYTKDQVHGSKQSCNICHVSHKMKGAGLTKKTITGLCLQCHKGCKGSTEHIVDIIPSMDVGGLLLVKGKMTCVTCHDSHKNTFKKMLRIGPEKLCQSCHAS